jgi:hypothetical protein
MQAVPDDVAFGETGFGAYYLMHVCGFPGFHWRVLPMAAVVSVAGFMVGEAMRVAIAETHLSAAMPTLLTITIFFCQYCVTQALIDAGAAHANVCVLLETLAAAANCQKNKRVASLVRDACTGFVYSDFATKQAKQAQEGGKTALHDLESFASDDASDQAIDRESIVGIVLSLHLLRAASLGGTLKWCRTAMMDVILLTMIMILPICLLSVMGRGYLVVLTITVVVILGIYDTALAGKSRMACAC